MFVTTTRNSAHTVSSHPVNAFLQLPRHSRPSHDHSSACRVQVSLSRTNSCINTGRVTCRTDLNRPLTSYLQAADRTYQVIINSYRLRPTLYNQYFQRHTSSLSSGCKYSQQQPVYRGHDMSCKIPGDIHTVASVTNRVPTHALTAFRSSLPAINTLTMFIMSNTIQNSTTQLT
jgi:hypothetical protein